MTKKYEIFIDFTNDETGEVHTMKLNIETWYYRGTMEEPEESGFEWNTRFDYPEWITDSIIDEKIADMIYNGELVESGRFDDWDI
jgi:hypothetical protein